MVERSQTTDTPGDRILFWRGKSTHEMSRDEAVEALRECFAMLKRYEEPRMRRIMVLGEVELMKRGGWWQNE